MVVVGGGEEAREKSSGAPPSIGWKVHPVTALLLMRRFLRVKELFFYTEKYARSTTFSDVWERAGAGRNAFPLLCRR